MRLCACPFVKRLARGKTRGFSSMFSLIGIEPVSIRFPTSPLTARSLYGSMGRLEHVYWHPESYLYGALPHPPGPRFFRKSYFEALADERLTTLPQIVYIEPLPTETTFSGS